MTSPRWVGLQHDITTVGGAAAKTSPLEAHHRGTTAGVNMGHYSASGSMGMGLSRATTM